MPLSDADAGSCATLHRHFSTFSNEALDLRQQEKANNAITFKVRTRYWLVEGVQVLHELERNQSEPEAGMLASWVAGLRAGGVELVVYHRA